jgi:diphthine synthase
MVKGKLTFIGLGLYDEKDISLKGVNEIKNCDKVYAEFYTAKLVGTNINKLERIIKKNIKILTREETEKGDNILNSAKNEKVAFLTCGDSMSATTHIDLRIRAISKGIKTKIIHGSSIITAVPGLLGLQNYKFGRTTTLAYPKENYFPTSPYDIIKNNKAMGLHTLVLLDIQANKDRYMTANEGMKLLLDIEKKRLENVITNESIICVVGLAGSSIPTVKAGKIGILKDEDFGKPLHSLVVPGVLHFMEIEALEILAGLPSNISKKLHKL